MEEGRQHDSGLRSLDVQAANVRLLAVLSASMSGAKQKKHQLQAHNQWCDW